MTKEEIKTTQEATFTISKEKINIKEETLKFIKKNQKTFDLLAKT